MRKYQSAFVLGLGFSGEAAANLLLAEGSEVTAVDRSDDPDLRARAKRLVGLGARVCLGVADLPPEPVSVCVVSPGVSSDSAWMKGLRERRIPVISELELGWSRARCRVLAVTGSNGKSTLVRLCADFLSRAGFKTAVAGNHEDCATGQPLPVSRIILGHEQLDWLVLEVSSFQLETVVDFRPDVGVLLNIFPNHLDRHGDMDAYRRIKLRMFSMMTDRDVGIVPDDMVNGRARPLFQAGKAQWLSFGMSKNASFRYENGFIFSGDEKLLSLSGTMFDNESLGPAAAAAAAAAGATGISPNHVENSARLFRPLPHRIQEVGALKGVRFVDDSKGTNIEATRAALAMTKGPVRLIAGGKPKGDDYAGILGTARGRVVKAYLIGEAADAMHSAWGDSIPCLNSATLDAAVRSAFEDSVDGETILLSPGCSSMDQFSNYRERGDEFIRLVEELRKKYA